MARILIQDLCKSYPPLKNGDRRVLVLDDISLDIKEGEFVTFFGPNGCGKTTLLKVLAGVESFDSGSVAIDSKTPQEAKTGLVFQNYNDSLMPWLSCRDNILFPFTLKRRNHGFPTPEDRLEKLASSLTVELPLDNYPYQLSGGQQQLTSILRTLIYEPDVILMDEPFSSLDYQTRATMQKVLLDLWEREKPTILFVSHDIEEAIFLADRLVLLEPLPTTVGSLRNIPFSRPRSRNLFESDDFFHIKTDCLKQMKKEVI